MRLYIYCVFSFFIFPGKILCQINKTFAVHGRVIGHEKNINLGFANASILNQSDSTFIKGMVTDSLGKFNITKVNNGNYILRVSFIGYKDNYSKVYVNNSDTDVGNIELTEGEVALQETVIEAARPMIVNKIDRIEFNVSRSILLKGSNVWDALGKTPGVMTDNRGSVRVSGKEEVIIMINDKPTNLSVQDVSELLKGMSTDNVESIEVITNPPAKYDAEGNAGIINIKLKKNMDFGFNGNARVNMIQGARLKYGSGINWNYRQKKVNLYGSYDFRQGNYLVKENNFIDFFQDEDTSVNWEETNDKRIRRSSHGYSINLDYNLKPDHVIGFHTDGFLPDNSSNTTTDTYIYKAQNMIDSTLTTKNGLKSDNQKLSYNVNYAGAVSKNSKLNLDLDYTSYNSEQNQDIAANSFDSEKNLGVYRLNLRSDSKQDIGIGSVKADVSHTFNKNSLLEFGAKATSIRTDNDIKFYTLEDGGFKSDSSRTNRFKYQEDNQALYVSVNSSLKKLEYKIGLRGEYTHSIGTSLTLSQAVDRKYFQLFPTLFLQYKLNDEHTIGFSYGRRISRPDYWRLNPFRFYSSPYSYIEGNPFLRPSFTHALKLLYNYRQQYFISLYMQQTQRPFTQISRQNNETNQYYYEQINLSSSTTAGASLNAQMDIVSWWSVYGYFNFYYKTNNFNFIEDNNFKNSNLNFDFSLSNTLSISKDYSLSTEVSFNYYSPKIQGAFLINDRSNLSVGMKKGLWNDKATLSLLMSDLFYTSYFDISVNYLNQKNSFISRSEERFFQASFSYKFGNNKVKKSRNRTTGIEDENDRLKR